MSKNQQAVEVCLILMRAAFADEVRTEPGLFERLGSFFDFLNFCDFHHVLPVVAIGAKRLSKSDPAVADHLPFFSEFEQYAIDRNQQIIRQLQELQPALIGSALQHVYLKGSAAILENNMDAVSWRFMSDIDILVSKENLEKVIACLRSLGYRPDTEFYDSKSDHHYPMMVKEEFTAGIEIHTALATAKNCGVLDPKELIDKAVAIDSVLGTVLIPRAEDRLAHIVVHGMISNHQYRRRRIVLREALDFLNLTKNHEIDLNRLNEKFSSYGFGKEFAAFVGLMERVWDYQVSSKQWNKEQARWTTDALNGLAEPESLRGFLYWDWASMIVKTLISPRELAGLTRILGNREARERFLKTRLKYRDELK